MKSVLSREVREWLKAHGIRRMRPRHLVGAGYGFNPPPDGEILDWDDDA